MQKRVFDLKRPMTTQCLRPTLQQKQGKLTKKTPEIKPNKNEN